MQSPADNSNELVVIPRPQPGGGRGWQRWAPYAAMAWSLIYAGLGAFWAAGGRGFPYTAEAASDLTGPLLARFSAGFAWAVVVLVGLPAVALGVTMLRGAPSRASRRLLIALGCLVAGAFLLLMTSLNLLVRLGYLPYALVNLLTGGEKGPALLEGFVQWAFLHQVLCLVGGFLWLAATLCYSRRSQGACLYCGRRDTPVMWRTPEQAARWGRNAVILAMLAPVFYFITRFAWAVGIPLGMSEAYWRRGQESGNWIAGFFLASFGLVGAFLMLGLVQRWGEIFPRWMVGLAGRRVPIALAVTPAALVSVILLVGGIGIWADLGRVVAFLSASGAQWQNIFGEIFFQLGPTLLFPLWGAALAVATLGYYYRRRGACRVCGRGASPQAAQIAASHLPAQPGAVA